MADLITTNNVYLDILDYPNKPVNEQQLIAGIITAASKAVELRCNRIFGIADYTETRNGTGENFIVVNNVPINSLTKIVFKSSTDSTVLGANFLFDPEVGEIRWKKYNLVDTIDSYGYFPAGFRNIELHYSGGFAAIPELIQQVCAQVVIQLFNREDADFQLTQDRLGNRSIGFDQNKILFTHRAALSLYRIRTFNFDPLDF